MTQKKSHQEKQFSFSHFLKDFFIKSIDSVIILFFITTTLTSAGTSQKIILSTALLVIILISLIMGISAYIAAKGEKNHFSTLVNIDLQKAEDLKERRLLENLGTSPDIQLLAQEEIDKDRKNWKNLMQQLGNGKYITDKINPPKDGLTTMFAYIFGGSIPIIAYLFTTDTTKALQFSGILSLTILFILGYFKSAYRKTPLIGGAIASLLSGAFAGTAGYFIAKLFIHGI